MNAASVDIKTMLVSESSLGLVFKTNLFIARTPPNPSDCVTIIDTGGVPNVSLDSNAFYRTSIQIRVRHTDYVTGYNLLNNIMITLNGRAQETLGGTLYSSIIASSEPAYLGNDENSRFLFSINFNIRRR